MPLPQTQTTGDPTAEITQIASELRALANAGLRFTHDPYQIERYHRVLDLSARLGSLVDERGLQELRRIFLNDLAYMTPYAVVDTAVFDDAGKILLIQRADNQLWAMPGGACDVGETAANAAAREVWEETGYMVEITDLMGVFDNRSAGDQTFHHLYTLLFAGRVNGGSPQVTRETVDIGWFASHEIPWDALSGSHAIRIGHALRWYADPRQAAHFDREPWTPAATGHHD
jgi:ADP-ribose pyrophosphatase YjhB (NUDIX family)